MWRRLRALRWDVTPVVVQDPTWEQSFRYVGGVLLPLGDVESGSSATCGSAGATRVPERWQ